MRARNALVSLCFAFFITWIALAVLITSCREKKVKKQGIENGKEMAAVYCASCHQFVAPEILNKDTWEKQVLPNMATRLGVRVWGQSNYYQPNPGDTPAIAFDDWMDIVAYYKSAAPAEMPVAQRPVPLVNDWGVFALKKMAVTDTFVTATTCMIRYDSASGHIYTGTENPNALRVWNTHGTLVHSFQAPSPVVHASLYKNPVADTMERMFTCIGQLLATNEHQGRLLHFNPEKDKDLDYHVVAAFQPRPVQAAAGDFNRDGLTDYIVCGFGHDQGALMRMTQQASHRFDMDTIKAIPGSLQAQTGDFNHDGWTDVMVLFADAREGISLFLNNQHGGFTEKRLLDFLPVWGSSSFQYTDVNGDGQPDIIYTCGDNADYSAVLKPFHGMYIYLNQGNMQFKQAYFYPVHGCYKAMAADFDGDGDLDIATIAFFNDVAHTPEEGFVYFEQDRPMHFIPHALPIYKMGHWISMDVADYDQDGDPDILLGNFAKWQSGTGKAAPWNERQPFIILSNKTK